MNITAVDITTSSVLLNWTEPNGQSSRYHVEFENNSVNTENTSIEINDLAPGVQYTFRVFAVAADHVTEGRASQISLFTKPDIIMNLTANDITTSSVLLNWTEPNGQSSRYRVECENNNVTTENNSIEINHLTPGAPYTFRVFAVAADHVTEGRASQISVYTKPDVIRNLSVSEFTTSSVYLAWEESAGNRDFFQINWTDEKTSDHVTTNNTWYNITDLSPGVHYTFFITAFAADKSTEGESVVTSKYTKPDVIMNLTAHYITTSSVLLNWTEPNGQSSRYLVEYENNNVTTETNSIEINHLTPGAPYTFRVFAVAADHVTEGRASQISLYTKPDVIMNLTANDITTSSVLLNWTKPNGQSSRYHVEYENNNVATENNSFEINHLTPGAHYTFRVFAVAADHVTEGRASQISLYTKPDVIMNLTANDITTSSVLLNWTKPNGQSSRYHVEYENNNVATENNSFEINDLTPGVHYTFRVFAVAADHVTEGRASQISLYTNPDVIRNLTVSNITTSSVFLTWEEPAGNRSFFKLKWADDKTSGNSTETTDTSYQITGLTAGVNYTFCITAVTADKSTKGETVCSSQITKPDVIRNLRVSEITTSSVFLIWEEPFGNRYFFKLNWTDGKTSNHVITNNTWYNITGLTAGVNYTFNIAAVAADKSTEGGSVVTSNYTKPDVIMNLTANDITTSSVLLNWTKPNGQSSRYHVEYENNNVATENNSFEINDLTPGAHYTFRVFAVAADHVTKGRASQISLYTNPDVIRNLTVSNITTASVFLTWEEPVGNRSFFKLKWADDKTSGNSTETTNTSYQITGLTAGVNYTFCITAVTTDKSTKGETVCSSQITKPNVIRNLTVTNITTSSVFLTWDKPIGNRYFFQIYWIYEKTNRNSTETSNTFYNFTDLTAGVNYTFCITAVAGNKSTGETFCISKYTKPNVIRNPRVTNFTSSSVFLTWDEPFGNRDFFRIGWTEKRMIERTIKTSYHATGLTAGVNYTFCITAVTADESTEGITHCISQFTSPSNTESNTWLIVGVVLAVICFLTIITLILFFYSRRQTKKQCP
ncbi:receptor-type tyrosine-protein phosphatase eta-like [Cyprinus carpio]|uniref:Receptor-type tyrosine-protein phosphatase eta-like n=1 Tax=Cyprinus carpio TaxID=7962 RepID=A0A9Q9VVB6_CYPCA|nr:receptor-type tyrosine-protein phosphatase eta-like [Cyprinus carpio]